MEPKGEIAKNWYQSQVPKKIRNHENFAYNKKQFAKQHATKNHQNTGNKVPWRKTPKKSSKVKMERNLNVRNFEKNIQDETTTIENTDIL